MLGRSISDIRQLAAEGRIPAQRDEDGTTASSLTNLMVWRAWLIAEATTAAKLSTAVPLLPHKYSVTATQSPARLVRALGLATIRSSRCTRAMDTGSSTASPSSGTGAARSSRSATIATAGSASGSRRTAPWSRRRSRCGT